MSSGDEQADSRIPFVDIDDLLSKQPGHGAARTTATPPVDDGAPAADTQTTEPDVTVPAEKAAPVARSGFRLHSLDPLFYLIIALAALGLVGSLYALISQNNAYFDREFQQLQRESAELNARLAANEAIIASAGRQTVVPQPKQSSATQMSESQSIIQNANNQVTEDDFPGEVAEVKKSEQVVKAVVAEGSSLSTESGESIVDEVVKTDVDSTIRSDDLSAEEIETLKGELQSLQAAVSSQEVLIQQLMAQNRALSSNAAASKEMRAKEKQNEETKVAKPVESTPVATISAEPQVTMAVETGVSLADADSESAGTRGLVARAYENYQQRNYQQALELYRRAVEFDPYHRDANLGIAASAQFLGEYALAENCLLYTSPSPRDS